MRRNKVVRTDEYIICNHARDEGIIDAYEKKKKKTNAVMLNSIPKWVCIAMILITITQVIGICYLYHTNKCTQGIFEITLGELLSVGIGIIAIAVSAWVGLNIYISMSKEEIKDLGDRLKLYEDKMKVFDTYDSKHKEKLWGEFQQLFVGSRYLIDDYFLFIFGKNDLLLILDSKIEYHLINAQREFNQVCALYEENKYEDSVRHYYNVMEQYSQIEKELLNIRRIDNSNLVDQLLFYIKCREADLRFYYCAGLLRSKSKELSVEDMRDVTSRWKDIGNEFEKRKETYRKNNIVKAYIANSIGYTMDLKHQKKWDVNDEELNEATSYMEKAVLLLDNSEEWNTIKARYLRNLGLTHDRRGLFEKARTYYKLSLEADSSDYKSWCTYAATTIKIFERDNQIQERVNLLFRLDRMVFAEKEKEFWKSVRYCEKSIGISPSFKDPYNKLIQLYTYIYLAQPKKNKDILSRIEDIVQILDIMHGCESKGALFAIRNYYEAIEDIELAKKWNYKVYKMNEKEPGGDYYNASKLYENYIKEKKK